MLFVILKDGSFFQQHVASRKIAENMVSYMEHYWAEWMGERIFPRCWD